MKSIRTRLLVAALAVLLGGAIAKSQTADTAPPPPHMFGPAFGIDGHMIGFYIRELGITEDQQTQMKATLQKEHATLKPLMRQLHQLNQQLKPYAEGTYDPAKVQALVTAQAQTLVQLKVNETRIGNELYQILTPEQQSQMKQKDAEREAYMQQHMHGQAPEASQE